MCEEWRLDDEYMYALMILTLLDPFAAWEILTIRATVMPNPSVDILPKSQNYYGLDLSIVRIELGPDSSGASDTLSDGLPTTYRRRKAAISWCPMAIVGSYTVHRST